MITTKQALQIKQLANRLAAAKVAQINLVGPTGWLITEEQADAELLKAEVDLLNYLNNLRDPEEVKTCDHDTTNTIHAWGFTLHMVQHDASRHPLTARGGFTC